MASVAFSKGFFHIRTLPGTAIKLTFIKVSSGSFPPLFYSSDPGTGGMATVNAGNSDALYVGGDGINGGFAKALTGLRLDAYETRHKALVTKALGGGAPIEAYPDGDPMAFSLVYAEEPTAELSGSYDGICFVDVFSLEHRPHNVAANAAMLYLAPPNGPRYHDAKSFLAAIRRAASNIATTMGRYRKVAAANSVPNISVLRLCLFSSGLYNTPHNLHPSDIAQQIYGGLCSVLIEDDCGLSEVQLPVGGSLFDVILNQA
ncbi:hypothetical protein [Mesorhizobium sp.]|uniref:hypothetical protein n=1 Tax=Mesorhizobium sp. TaxID=1871066 RepID=UPI000FE39A79|nr:hypothetical protein [Mesorhizobium sp.]RWN59386.1 MAG: hypothetical protein EOR98_03150 [Mesorhizobium sp.]RWN80891.1 MAG: hypothetical protein EOS02_03140 [Mesorhizobium sp.]RWN83322.1 MAG: hypothetical protein EOS01_03200 [Mesorhizobium sp.]RWN86760.1 MAG: hypothetical protein EOS04_17840 [Mesorhizobium sp.]RWO16395.1 MAG: hypothetical protein EOS15_05235 [Mesorhizobium sp.]